MQTIEEARAEVAARAQTAVRPTLETAEIDAILTATQLATVWAATTAYRVGARIVPTVRGGYHFRCVQAGTTGATEPTWPGLTHNDLLWASVQLGMRIFDGTVVWELAGADWGETVYDVPRAIYQAWLDKAAKATVGYAFSADGQSYHREQIIAHCLQMAEHYRPVGCG